MSYHPLSLSPSGKEISHFPTQGWSIVLSLVISPGWMRGVQTCLCLPFRNHHFSRINSTPHSLADKVHCLCLGWGGGPSCKARLCSQRWMIACCVRHSSIRCSFWGGLVGGGCPQAEVAVAGTILIKLQKQFQLSGTGRVYGLANPARRWIKISSQCSLKIFLPGLNRPTPLWLYWRFKKNQAVGESASHVSVDGLQYKTWTVNFWEAKMLVQQYISWPELASMQRGLGYHSSSPWVCCSIRILKNGYVHKYRI